jgi:ankyrin repeat protein
MASNPPSLLLAHLSFSCHYSFTTNSVMKRLLLITIAAVLLTSTAFSGPIHDAAGAGRKKVVEQHIANGADVNAKAGGSHTPLHGAVLKGHKEIAELLIANGADVNAKVVSGTEQGKTPLNTAIEKNAPKSPISSANTPARPRRNWKPLATKPTRSTT